MRWFLVPSALLLLLASCGPTLTGPTQTDALDGISGASALEIASARQAALDFVEAYAHAHSDGGAALASLVDGPKLRSWIHWFDVQNRAFPGTIDVNTDVGSLRFVSSGTIGGVPGAEVDLGASLTFDYRPQGADPFSVTRSLDGPVTLVRVGTGDWRVIDATRDGQPMDGAIQLFKNVEQVQQKVNVTVDSVFMFAPRWQFNVIVRNAGSHPIVLDTAATAVYVKRTDGAYVPTKKTAITPSLLTIAPGTTIEGLISVPMQPSAKGRILEIPFALGSKLLRFQFALQGVLKQIPVPAPTATAPAPAGSN